LAAGARARRQLLQALSFLHARRVVHRDVKPENIVLREAGGDAIVLVDFGISADLERLIQTVTATATVGLSPLSRGAPLPARSPSAPSLLFCTGLVIMLLRGVLVAGPRMKGRLGPEAQGGRARGLMRGRACYPQAPSRRNQVNPGSPAPGNQVEKGCEGASRPGATRWYPSST
jgi:serine/threonine protein kinase